jgi:hypothetical protein
MKDKIKYEEPKLIAFRGNEQVSEGACFAGSIYNPGNCSPGADAGGFCTNGNLAPGGCMAGYG